VQVVKLVVEVLHVQRRIHDRAAKVSASLADRGRHLAHALHEAAAASGHLRAEPRAPVGDVLGESPLRSRSGIIRSTATSLRSCRVVSPSTSSSGQNAMRCVSTSTISSPRTSSFAASRSRPTTRGGTAMAHRPGEDPHEQAVDLVEGSRRRFVELDHDPGSVASRGVAALTREKSLGGKRTLFGATASSAAPPALRRPGRA